MADLLARVTQRARGKALYDLHPELQHRIPILRVFSGEAETPQGEFQSAATEYKRNTWVHKAIKVLADNIAPLRLQIIETRAGEDEVVENHALAPLLAQPNPVFPAAELWRQWLIDMMLGGESGFEVVASGRGAPAELWPRQPHTIFVIPDSQRARYFEIAEFKIDDGVAQPYTLEADELIFFRFYNPLNPWRGLAPITAVRTSIQIDVLAQAWSRMFFRNSARPDYAVIAPEGLTKSNREEILAELAAEYGGTWNAHRPIVLEDGITDIKTFSFAPKDMEWVNQRELSRDEIGAIFGVPDEVMGYGRDTYENFATALQALWNLTLIPLIQFRDASLTAFFQRTREISPTQAIISDLSDVAELQEAEDARWTRTQSQISLGARTINEWREEEGLDPVPWGDVWWAPFSLTPVSGPETEGGANPLELLGYGNKAMIPEFGSALHEGLWKQVQVRLDPFVVRMQRQLKRDFQRQQIEVGRRLRNAREFGRGLYKVEEVFPPITGLFDPDDEAAKFQAAYKKLLDSVYVTVGGDELAGLGLDLAFDLQSPTVQAAIKDVLLSFSNKVNQTTFADLTDLFQEAELAGESIPEIMERLSAYFEGRKSDFQTERIARTTMTAASNSAAVESWDQSGVVRSKTWLSAFLPTTRDDHARAHGQTVGLKEQFEVGPDRLAHPGDPAGTSSNVINCVCAVVAQVQEGLHFQGERKALALIGGSNGREAVP